MPETADGGSDLAQAFAQPSLQDGLRLAQRQQLDRLLLHRGIERIDLGVVGDHLFGDGRISVAHRGQGLGELALGQAAHLVQGGVEPFQLFVEALEDMVARHVLVPLDQPNRPVM